MIERLILLMTLPVALLAQQKTITLQAPSASAAIDRPGDIYLVSNGGTIQHYDGNGEVVSLWKSSGPELFDPRDGARLFAFFRQSRRVDYLNPAFEVAKSFLIDSAIVIDPWLVCPSGDYNIWALDRADKTAKKIIPAEGKIIVDVPLREVENMERIKFIREYQGFLFVHDVKKGIHIYSGMGKYLRTIGSGSTGYFNFLGEDLYYPEGNSLQFFNLFNAEKRTVDLPRPAVQALLSDEHLFLIDQKMLYIFPALH